MWWNLSAGFSCFLLILLKAAHQITYGELTLCCIAQEENEAAVGKLYIVKLYFRHFISRVYTQYTHEP